VSTPGSAPEADRLLSFCQTFVERRGSWPPSEDTLVREFVSFCGITAFGHFDTLTQLCVQLGVSVFVRPMPSELRGHNSSYNGNRTITIAEQQWFPGAKEHSLLHELRELLEHTFVHLGFAIASAPEDLEKRAEHFACLARSTLAQEMIEDCWRRAEQVERKWMRYSAYLLTVLGGLAVLISCLFLPTFEDQALEFHRRNPGNKPRANSSVS
jgi:hypothetical protein